MKNHNLLYRCALLILFTPLISCQKNKIKIAGIMEHRDQNFVSFNQIGNPLQELEINDQNQFSFNSDTLKKGYYTINNTLIYLVPGFDLNIRFTEKETIFDGIGSTENNILRKMRSTRKEYSVVFEDKIKMKIDNFKNDLQNTIDDLKKLLQKENLDTDFVATELKKIDMFQKVTMVNYAKKHGVKDSNFNEEMLKIIKLTPERQRKKYDSLKREMFKDQLPKSKRDFIDSLAYVDFKLNDSILFSSGSSAYRKLLNNKLESYSMAIRKNSPRNFKRDDFITNNYFFLKELILDSLTYPPLREYYLYKVTETTIKSTPEYATEFYDYFNKYSSNAINKKRIANIYNNITLTAKGNPSLEFKNYKNAAGGTTSLQDLKGSYVYIDVWATWCGPCLVQIPHLKQLEEEYRNSNVKFVSISVDDIKKQDDWLEMVKNKKLSGIQIMADQALKSDFIKSYNISSIPRFLLIDPEGNIISNDAPKPSSSKLKKLFANNNIKSIIN